MTAFGYRSAQPRAQGDASRLVAQATGIASIAAGIIHISAAADHANLPVMSAGFMLVAWLQGGLGRLAASRAQALTPPAGSAPSR